MKSLWNDADANACQSLRALRVYSSRLLGSDPNLVLHGGGNTSVKETITDLHGDEQQILTVKGSGWDLGTIEEAGFAPVRMDTLLKLAQLDQLSDSDMVREQKAAMIDPSAPNPSIEAILHALIPFTFVDHSHADAVVTITNTPDGDTLIREALGDKVLVVPYVMPGFILAKTIAEMTQDCDWSELEGIALMNHGLFTFADDAKQAYEKHIELVTRAEQFLSSKGATLNIPSIPAESDLLELATIRKITSELKGAPVLARLNHSDLAITFANYPLEQIPRPGPLTPEHVIRTKSFGAVLDADQSPEGYRRQLADYQLQYQRYFDQQQQGEQCLNTAPNYALWKQHGAIAFGSSVKELSIIEDLNQHTFEAILKAEALGGYQALEASHLFEIEYWELEQAKLAKAGKRPALTGKVVMIAEQDQPLRAAITDTLRAQGAEVHIFDAEAPDTLVLETVRQCGGIDALVVNMGSDGAEALLKSAAPFLKQGISPSILYINAETAESHSGVRNNYLSLSSESQLTLAAELAGSLVADNTASAVSVNI